MARIDSILAIVASQNANELRLGTDREPRMLAHGAARRLAIPITPEDTLRDLLGEILSAEREQALRSRGRVDFGYEAAGVGKFQVSLTAREKGFDVVFLKSARKDPPAVAPQVVVAPAVAPVASLAPAPSGAAPVVAPLAPVVEHAPSPSVIREAAASLDDSLLAHLVVQAAAMRASDLHLADGEPPRVRVDGVLHGFGDGAPIDVLAAIPLDAAERARLATGGSLDAGHDLGARVRLHVYRTAGGLAAAVRLLPSEAPSLASLRLPVAIDDLVMLPNGLVLVCGATGSGKSSTLAALAREALRRRSIVLTTLEDPIEHALESTAGSLVRRRQVGREVADFASGLRDALREDPDVLLVGEMRDPETIALALTAAETGHLVLASLHSRSAASAIERIVDSYGPGRESQIRVQLADSLRAVVAQRLLPSARGAGRVAAVEVLRVTHAVASLIREGKTAQIPTAIQSGKREGMLTLERSLADRVRAGEIRAEDAHGAANDAESLTMFLAK